MICICVMKLKDKMEYENFFYCLLAYYFLKLLNNTYYGYKIKTMRKE